MSRALAVAIVLAAGAPAIAQPSMPAADWKEWSALVGEWEGDTTGAGAPTGSFTLAPDLQGRVLVRKSYAEYPKSDKRPASRHDDLMVLYREGDATKADYWDNEGHRIRYVATVDKGKSFTFLSDVVSGQPRFRLTYAITGQSTLSLRFEIALPNAPEQFKPYIQATAHRKH